MNKQIINCLEALEKEKNIKILFAVENGSRNWGIESDDSDYDVRFVYTKRVNDYLYGLKNNESIRRDYPEHNIDLVGFEIHKFVNHLTQSNPTPIEWITSDILYYGKIPDEYNEYVKLPFHHKPLFHHYKSLAKQNFRKYLKPCEEYPLKRTIYVLRGLCNAEYIDTFQEIPPANLLSVLDRMKDKKYLLYNTPLLENLVALKKQSNEKDTIHAKEFGFNFDNYIEYHLSLNPRNVKAEENINHENEKLRQLTVQIIRGEQYDH